MENYFVTFFLLHNNVSKFILFNTKPEIKKYEKL